LDVWSNQGAKREMGGTYFKWGRRVPLAPTLATALSNSGLFPGGGQKHFLRGANSGEISFYQLENKRKNLSTKKLIGK